MYISLSARITVSLMPTRLKPALINFEISFFFNALLIKSKESPAGRISESIALPTVVSCRFILSVVVPSRPN